MEPAQRDTLIQHFHTAAGADIYQIPLDLFPGLAGYVYLVHSGEYQALIDTGSGFGRANEMLAAGLQAVEEMSGRPTGFDHLTHILITHGHIDHFGGLAAIYPHTAAKIGVHELDRRILTNYEERLVVISRRLNEYLIEAGVSDDRRTRLMEMYNINKALFRSVPVDFTYEEIGMRLGPFNFLHTPGHCAGHVVIKLHDVMFSGDHILHDTSPHQSPERLTLSTGLDHYLKSLAAVEAWSEDVRLTLGGHKQPILNIPERVQEIRQVHAERLRKVVEILRTPATIAEVADRLFGEVRGYDALLAIEETGAHVEYLYGRGGLEIDNLNEWANASGPAPIRYHSMGCA